MNKLLGLAGVVALMVTSGAILAKKFNEKSINPKRDKHPRETYYADVPVFDFGDTEEYVIKSLIDTAPSIKVFYTKYADYLVKKYGDKIYLDAIYLNYMIMNEIVTEQAVYAESEKFYTLYKHNTLLVDKFGVESTEKIYNTVITRLYEMGISKIGAYDCYSSITQATNLERIIPSLESYVEKAWLNENYSRFFFVFYKLLALYEDSDTDKFMSTVYHVHDIISVNDPEVLGFDDEKKLYQLYVDYPQDFDDIMMYYNRISEHLQVDGEQYSDPEQINERQLPKFVPVDTEQFPEHEEINGKQVSE